MADGCPKHQAGGTRSTSAAVCICEPVAPEWVECKAWFGDRAAGGSRCRRPQGHPPRSEDGIGHDERPLPLVAEENVLDLLQHIASLHSGFHTCVGGNIWTDLPTTYGGSIAVKDTCPTAKSARAAIRMLT